MSCANQSTVLQQAELLDAPVLEPTVGAVDTTDPSVILYISVVFPALSRLADVAKNKKRW
jgi:hypothetical protein